MQKLNSSETENVAGGADRSGDSLLTYDFSEGDTFLVSGAYYVVNSSHADLPERASVSCTKYFSLHDKYGEPALCPVSALVNAPFKGNGVIRD